VGGLESDDATATTGGSTITQALNIRARAVFTFERVPSVAKPENQHAQLQVARAAVCVPAVIRMVRGAGLLISPVGGAPQVSGQPK